MNRGLASIVSGFSLLFSAAMHAAPQIPGLVAPGQAEKQFQAPPQLRDSSPDKIVPLRRQQAPDLADQIRFTLRQVKLEGFSVISEDTLSAIYQPYIDQEITLSDLYALADQLTISYRKQGYFLSQVFVPEQKIEKGVVELYAVEGFINDVVIDMNINDWNGLLNAFAQQIKNTRPLTSKALERYMLLINDLPGVSAKAVLSRSPTTFGAADLLIIATEKQLSGSVSIDNLGGQSLGPERHIASVQMNNLLGLFDGTSMQLVESGNGEMSYAAITHEQQLGSEGMKLIIHASETDSDPEELAFIPLELETETSTLRIDASWPIIRSRPENLYIRAGLKAYDGKTTLLGTPFSDEHIRVANIGLTYDFIDSTGGTNLIDVQFHQGIDGLGSSKNGDSSLSIADGLVDFSKINLFLAHLQPITGKLSFLAAFNGQYTDDTLLSPEQFSFGGETFGRGYDPSEKVADNGSALKLELRYRDSPVFSMYSFYDVGWVWNTKELPGDYNENTQSAGFGASFRMGSYLLANFELAKPMNEDVSAEGNNDTRTYFGLTASF